MGRTRTNQRGNGEGTIYPVYAKGDTERKNPIRWIAQYTVGIKANGKPNRKSISGKTRKEVADKLSEALTSIKNNTYTEKNKTIFIDLAKDIVEEKKKRNKLSERSYKRSYDTLKIIEKADFSSLPIQKITTDHLNDFLYSITYYSNSVIEKVYQALGRTFRKAVTKGIIHINPMADKDIVEKPKSDKEDKEVISFTDEEQKKFCISLSSSQKSVFYSNVMLLSLFGGFRCRRNSST